MSAYGTASGFTDWLEAHGLTLPAGADELALRTIGSAYVDAAYEPRLFCSRRADLFTQELAWPRIGAQISGQSIPDDLIPQVWINASYRAAWLEASQPGWATGGVNPSRMTKREKAGDVEREFFAAGEGGVIGNAAQGFNVDPLLDAMLAPWLCEDAGDGKFFLMSVGT